MSSSKRVVVTGGPGFIGRRVIDRFLKADWEAASVSLPGEPAQPHWGARVRMDYGDLCDATFTRDAVKGADLIIHLAAVVGMPGAYAHQWNVIAEGTRNVCEGAHASARIVVASSIAVYGDRIQTQICTEETPYGAWQGAYGRAKQGQERLAAEIAAARGNALTIIRPANVYGLGGASAWGDKLLAAFKATGGFAIGDAENNNAGLVYVENLADAIFAAATAPAAIGRTYNVCDDEDTTWRRFADDMAKIAGLPSPPHLELAPLWQAAVANEDPAHLVGPRDPNLPTLEGLNLIGFDNRFPSARIRGELNWAPHIRYAEALAEIARQYAAAA
ncbi:MAG: NAD(P)-dependent oxidoreductase [Terricaulis sp.]